MNKVRSNTKTIDRSLLIAGAEVLMLFADEKLGSKTMGEVREIAFKILSPEKIKEVVNYGNAPGEYVVNEDR
jgi:hypothetical protein